MTNEMIIFWNSVDLMNAGVIGTTGRNDPHLCLLEVTGIQCEEG